MYGEAGEDLPWRYWPPWAKIAVGLLLVSGFGPIVFWIVVAVWFS